MNSTARSSTAGSATKMMPPPAAPQNAAGAAPRGITLQPVLALMTDPATSGQYARHGAQLTATLQASRTGFSAQVARDGVPQVLAIMTRALAEQQPSSEELHDPLASLIQHCGQPIVCTTLNDQRVHVAALEAMMAAVAGVLELPHQVLRVTAATVLRQIFAQLRSQCFDDLNKSPHVTFHKKRDLDRAITPSLVRLLLASWRRSVDADVASVVASNSFTATGGHAASNAAGTPVEDDSSDDDAAIAGPAPTAAAAGEKGRSFEMITIQRAVLELSNYTRLCEAMIADGAIDLAFATLQLCEAGDQRGPLAVELLWNLLALCPVDAAPAIGHRSHLDTLHAALLAALSLGHKLNERELRNDLLVVMSLLARDEATLAHFSTELIDLLLVLGCGAEAGKGHAGVNPTHHCTTSAEDLQMKLLVWDTLAALCRDDDTAAHVFDWGFFDVLLAYVNVDCEIPAVVSWSTLQVLDIQGHVLRLLGNLMDRGCEWFAACHGPATLRMYIDDCPKIALRNQAVGVLSSAAATRVRGDLIGVGVIPLAIDLLDNNDDLDLRIDALNLLSDSVRREPALQRDFLEHGGVAAVLPLLTLIPSEFTDLLEDTIFAAVDCVWQCVFGSDASETRFVESGGVSALLTVLEGSPEDKASLPLSCLADLMQHPGAAQQCRAWRSPRSGRSGIQIALSFWRMMDLDAKPAAESVAENRTIGLEAVGCSTHKPLTSAPPPPPDAPAVEDDLNMRALDLRDSIRDPPADIAHIVTAQRTNFKVFAMIAMLGFDGHSELDALERATLAAVDSFIALCKDEVWENIEECLAAEGVVPIAADRAILEKLHAEAEERSTRLLATRRAYDEVHTRRKEEAELTFYQSLIKKTEERGVASSSSSKPMGLSITEAKIRKAQMLKQSFKQAVGQQQQQQQGSGGAGAAPGGGRPVDTLSNSGDEDDLPPSQRPARGRTGSTAAGPSSSGDAAATAEPDERWDPGQREMREDEYEVLRVLNEVRTNPASLVAAIEEKLQYLDESGSTFYVPGCDPETCVEGPAAYREAIEFLKSVRPLVTLLDVPVGMVFAARDHIADLAGRMDVSPDGSDKSNPQSRLKRYASSVGRFAQLTALGQRSAVGIVMQLVVDDGVSSRVDRQSIFDPDARLCGLSLGPHSMNDSVAVVMLAHEFTEINADEQRRIHANVLKQHASRK